MRTVSTALWSAATLAYPLVVWFGLGRVSPAWIAAALGLLAAARAWHARQWFWLVAAAGAALLALVSLGGSWLPLKLYPVMINGLLLAVFAASLWRGPSVVERLARITEPELPPAGVAYTRTVTAVWCGFFAVNGLLALITALWASDAVWALYNGLVAYVLMGLLFGIEWLVRQQVKARLLAERPRHG
jgi:uncharacterized membrane protein